VTIAFKEFCGDITKLKNGRENDTTFWLTPNPPLAQNRLEN